MGMTKNCLTERYVITSSFFCSYVCFYLLSKAGIEIYLAVSSALSMERMVN